MDGHAQPGAGEHGDALVAAGQQLTTHKFQADPAVFPRGERVPH